MLVGTRCRATVLPQVFANGESDGHTMDFNDHILLTWCEVAEFVKDAVIRQVLLGVASNDFAPMENRSNVLRQSVGRSLAEVAHDDDQGIEVSTLEGARQGFQTVVRGFNKGATKGQVFDRVPGEEHFGQNQNVGTASARFKRGVDDLAGIARQVTDDGIGLGKG